MPDDVRAPDAESVHSEQSMARRIKIKSNDELRRRFVGQTIPQIRYLGLELPDPRLSWNEGRGHHDFTMPGWKELFAVIKGNGPCNRDRVQAWEDGQWVRDALLARDRAGGDRQRR